MWQMPLFEPEIKKEVLLRAESPKNAFYRLWIECQAGYFFILKESGTEKRILDRRRWRFDDFESAEKRFDQIVREKIDPNRKSPRKYKIFERTEKLAA